MLYIRLFNFCLLDLPDLVARRCQRPEIPSRTPQDLKLLMAAMWVIIIIIIIII
jgi:hypothetical protein